MESELLKRAIAAALARFLPLLQAVPHPRPIPVGVSARHVHLSAADVEALYGAGHSLRPWRELRQPGQYAAEETVILAGPKGCLERVRVLGPPRARTQVEISRSDAVRLGLNPPVRESGDLHGSPGITLIGSKGTVQLREGLIAARRHVHMSPADAESFGVKDGENVRILAGQERGLIFGQVIVRVKQDFVLELHLDTDEANAAGCGDGDTARLLMAGSAGAVDEKSSPLLASPESGLGPVREALALVTERDIRKAWREGSDILVRKGGLVTPLARDTAKELGVQISLEVR